MVLLVPAAFADPTTRLAPGPPELAAAQAELEGRLLVAEAVAVAVARLQGAHSGLAGKGNVCDDPVRAESLTRLRHFADRWRASAQRVVVQADRLRETAAAATVEPIVDEERRDDVAALLARADAQSAQWRETVAWFQSSGGRACKDAPPLGSFPGYPPPAIQAADEVEGPAAITAVNGWVCPERAAGVRGAGELVLVPGRACWSVTEDCTCTPQVVYPGAVLGAEPLPPPPPLVVAPVDEVPGAEVQEAGPGEPAAPR